MNQNRRELVRAFETIACAVAAVVGIALVANFLARAHDASAEWSSFMLALAGGVICVCAVVGLFEMRRP